MQAVLSVILSYSTAEQCIHNTVQHPQHETPEDTAAQHTPHPTAQHICVMQVQGRGQSAPLASWTSMGLRASRRTALSSCASTWPMSGCSSSSTSTSSRASRYRPSSSQLSPRRARDLLFMQPEKSVVLYVPCSFLGSLNHKVHIGNRCTACYPPCPAFQYPSQH